MNRLVQSVIAYGIHVVLDQSSKFEEEHNKTSDRIEAFRKEMEQRSKEFNERQARRRIN